MNFPTYLFRRLRLYWQVLFTLALGVVLAVTLLASGPVMVESVLDFALHHTLETSEPVDAHLRFVTTVNPDVSTFQMLDKELSDVLYPRIEKYLDQVVPTGETQWSYPWLQDEAVKDQRVNFSFYGLDGSILLKHAEFTSGGWAEQAQPSENVIAAVIGSSMAEDYNLEVGDHLPLSFKPSADQPDLWLEVSGILKPLDYDDPFWFGTYNPLRTDTDTRYLAQYSILVPNDSFFELASNIFPASSVQIAWHAFLSPEKVKVEDLSTLKGQLQVLSSDVEALGLRVETGLADTIESTVIRTTSVRVPLYLLITTVVLLALYYVLMVATLSLRQARREFAILLSRGASTWQLMGVKLVEAGSICGVALLSGPGLALLLMRGLIQFGPLAETGKEYWTLQLPQAAWLAAIVGAVACLASVLSPLPGALRKSVVNYAQTLSRSGRPPWWQRYYLDVVLMLAGLILLWRLRIYGGILSQSGTGPQVDWLLLLAPLALLLGAATIMLRIFPLILQLMAQLVGEWRGLSSALAFWQAARDPGHIARLVLLLTLAMALGSLSSGLNVALDRNETDRAYYATGGDLRLQMSSDDQRSQPQGSVSELALAAQSAPGFDTLSGLIRTAGSLQLTIGNAHPPFDILAIEPESFQKVARFRKDFTSTSTDTLLNPLIRENTMDLPAYTLPGYPGRIGMWLLLPFQGELYVDQLSRNMSVTLDELSLVVKCITAQGEIITLQFSPVDSTVPLKNGWQYFEGSLPPLHDASYPVSLLSFWFRHRSGSTYYTSVFPQLAVDGLNIVDRRSGEATIVNLFEAGGPDWSTTTPGIELFMDNTYPRSGGSRLVLDFGLSGLDMTDWIGVNLDDGTMDIKEDGLPTGELGGSERQNREVYPLLLPDHPSQLGLWVVGRVIGQFEVGPDVFRAVGDLTTVDLEVRLRTQQGESYSFALQSMGEMPQEGYIQDRWQYFWTDLPDFSDEQYPLTLESFGLRVREDAFLPILVMDNLTVVDRDSGEEVLIDEFEGLNPPYWRLEPSQGIGYTTINTKGRAGSGLFLIFNNYGDLGKFGWLTIYPTAKQLHSPDVEAILANPQVNENDDQPPILPVLASPAFLDITQSEIGDRVGAWINSKPFILEILDVVQYFPTMLEEKDGGFIITSRDAILTELNEDDYLASNINEFFVSLEQNVPSQDVARQIQNSVGDDLQMLDVETLRQMIKADPLALGLRSVTTLGYLLTAVLSLVGFGTYFYMSVRQRRKMYGVLRAIGMSSVQIYGSLLLEQVVLIFSGLALGTGLGVLLNQLTLPGLPLNLGGQPPVPPFLAETDWAGVIRIYFTLAIAFLLSLAMATISLGRTKLHQVLRVDEE
jgi:ABC-type antimicrobial peptide transport system permease subunit